MRKIWLKYPKNAKYAKIAKELKVSPFMKFGFIKQNMRDYHSCGLIPDEDKQAFANRIVC